MENPLLNQGPLPRFSDIAPEHVEPALKQIISRHRAELTELLAQEHFTWDNLMQPLEEMQDRLSKMWSPISHMHSVAETEDLRRVYNDCLPLLTEYQTELMQHEGLYRAVQSIADSPEFSRLNEAQSKVIHDELRDFKLAGVNLPPTEKARFAELQKQLSKLSTLFGENLLDATNAWTLHITDASALEGLPEQTLKLVESNAQQRGLTGWVLTLDYPCYSSVMKYLRNRELRWLMYEAYATRASDQGPHAGRYDNTQIMNDILALRHELATLLGFKNYADYSLATKMADSPQRVLTFLNNLAKKSRPFAEHEIQEVAALAKEMDGIETLEAWDLTYYSEKCREKLYSLTQEQLRPYFPITKVLTGMFLVVNKLFGLRISERAGIDTWDPNVRLFDIFDDTNQYRGSFYTDLYTRMNKRDGAWMDEARMRRITAEGNIQHPVAYLTCNFARPIGHKPALLTHDDVQTLFHEFGHCLHHLLTQVNYASVSGINGVPWDAVEFPSQFLESWCWEKEAIALISGHYETDEPLPDTLYTRMIAAKNFQAGMQMLRQLEFALFDFRIHLEYQPNKEDHIQSTLNAVRNEVAVVPTPQLNRFQHSFSHIFAGGYAAGYYSYKWAEVLSADAYSLFKEKGIFNADVGHAFMKDILEKGGVTDPMKLFATFRGREPEVDALLRYSGLVTGEKP